MEKKTQSKKALIAIVALVAVIALLAGAYFLFKPQTVAGSKTLTISVVDAAKTKTEIIVKTDAKMLGEALLADKIIEGEEMSGSLFITKVNGIAADDAKKEWWCITKGGEQVNTGVDITPIADGEKYELTLSTY